MKEACIKEFENYDDVVREIEICRKYGRDYTIEKGMVEKFINRLHPAQMKLKVADVIAETSSASTLRLVSENGYLPPFQAGQYVSISLEAGGIRTSRPYSISSPPNQTGYYDLTIKRVEDGLISNYLLDHVKRNDFLTCSGPTGNFYHNPLFHSRSMVCIAGGSGITPFMSMIQEIADCGLNLNVILLYGNRTLEEAIFHNRLNAISNRFNNIRYYPVLETPPKSYKGYTGFITAQLIKNAVGDPTDKTFYICGPQGIYDFCIPELTQMGVLKKKIRTEVYAPSSERITDQPGWPKNVNSDDQFKVKMNNGKTFSVRAGEPLLKSLEKNGIVVPSQCRAGQCSYCRVKIVSGKVFQPEGTPVRRSDSRFGYVHSCVSYPLENLEILI